MKEEQEIKMRVVRTTIRESKETVLELSDSVDPVSTAGRSLEGLKTFLEHMQQEVTEKLPKEVQHEVRKTLARKLADFFLTILLKPAKRLLRELWAKAVMVIGQILGGN